MAFIAIILLVFSGLTLNPKANAQTADEIQTLINEKQKEINKLEEQAKSYRGVVKEKQKEVSTLNRQISIFDAQIGRLEAEIIISETKIEQADLEIQNLNLQIEQKEQEIGSQKQNISQALRTIYEYDQEDLLTLILKTNNFSDAFDQIQYLELLQAQLQRKLDEIKNLKMQMEERRVQIQASKQEQKALVVNLEIQQDALGVEKKERDVLLRQTKGEENKYQSLLSDILDRKKVFAEEIENLERQIYNEKKFIVRLTAPIPAVGPIFSWPFDNYVITQGYGVTSFALKYPGIYPNNFHNGIDLAAGRGSGVKSIGDGKVVAKGYNWGWGNWVAIQHTNGLISAYGHFSNMSGVAVGTEVKAGQVIGYEGSTGQVTGSHLHLGIFYDFFTFEKNGELFFNYLTGTLNPFNYLP